ncbi:MAG: FAD-dependent oxidoreductase [Planctomycetota bacterium]
MGRSSHPHYVIIGNGASAFAAIQAIHQRQPLAQIEVFSNEAGTTYFPSALGRLLSSAPLESLFYLTHESFYERFSTTLYRNSPVLELDFEKQRMRVEGKPSVPYDKLLIATGVSSHSSLGTVPCISSLKEFQRWKNILGTRRTIALEGNDIETLCWASHLIQQTKAKIFYFSPDSHFLPSVLDPQTSAWLEEAFCRLGGEIYFQTTIERFQTMGKQIELRSASQYWKVDFLMQSSQWKPNLSFLPEISERIPVNSFMETPWPHVYAAGSVTQMAEIPTPRFFGIAIQQGEIAGKNMTGEQVPLSSCIPLNSTEWFQIPIGWFGETVPKPFHKILEWKEQGIWKRLLLKDEQISGVLMLGDCQTLEMFYALAKNKIKSCAWADLIKQDPKKLFASRG